ncbi:creatininase family protein [Tianweitania sediminis]|uniref:Creatininase family protein n=1 Tax=Tianweitania sediminis TaxID=1502156 RepID=A0A8J7QWX5_9HYPH|nr:creatininase family protein [Tianweitania sediminis]MBP0438203.1 creatininase family protein [Tianweitania sediminis]
MTKTEADKRSAPIAVLPLGATEQHGPHLPFETDTIIARGIVERLRSRMPHDLDVRFLPAEPIGYSPEHLYAEGTRSLPYHEAVERWIGIGEKQAAHGVRRFVLLNAHGGNSPLMTVVATELRRRFAMLAVATSWTRFALPNNLIDPGERTIGIHGGLIETSVMLALRPDLVDMAKAADFASRQSHFAREFRHLRAYGPHAFGWLMTDLSPSGVVGNAAGATAAIGEQILQSASTGILELLRDVARFDLGLFDKDQHPPAGPSYIS